MSTTTRPKPPPTTTHPTTILSPQASLTGSYPITLAANAVVHLRAKLVATYGPVHVAEFCIISERACVGVLGRGEDGEKERGVVLERGVVVETGAVVEGGRVGEGTVVEVGAKVGRGSVIGKHCKIGPLCTVPPNSTLPDFTVVYGNNQRRVERPGLENIRASFVQKHVEVLRALNIGKGAKSG